MGPEAKPTSQRQHSGHGASEVRRADTCYDRRLVARVLCGLPEPSGYDPEGRVEVEHGGGHSEDGAGQGVPPAQVSLLVKQDATEARGRAAGLPPPAEALCSAVVPR